ncbi:hypothetical protein BDY24DRAFT_375498 [Mrakia frigida]|uniref:uncharacterized protein n=1 Tax=Mrakia frigida TaxID=29902 RepID=UPI003FCC240A
MRRANAILDARKVKIYQSLISTSPPIVSVDLSLSRYSLHSQIWRTSYPSATIILHVDKNNFQGPFELKGEEDMDDFEFDWKADRCYFFDDDQMLLNELPDEFKRMDGFICSGKWTFEKGVVVVGVPKKMVSKILKVVFQTTPGGKKAKTKTSKKWVWLEKLDDQAIVKEIKRAK